MRPLAAALSLGTALVLALAGCQDASRGAAQDAPSPTASGQQSPPASRSATARPSAGHAETRFVTVAFPDEAHGWAVSQRCPVPLNGTGRCTATIEATADAGGHWSVQARGLQPVDRIRFTDSRHGYAWREPECRRLYPVGCTDVILATVDGGAHWRPGRLPPPGYWLLTASGTGSLTRVRTWADQGPSSMTWPADRHGWAVIDGRLARTRDGGRSWRSIS